MDALWIAGIIAVLVFIVVIAVVVSNVIDAMFGVEQDWYDLDFSDDD